MSSNDNPPPKGSEQSKQEEQPDSPPNPHISPVGSKEAPPASAQSTPKGGKDAGGALMVGLFLFLFGVAIAYTLYVDRKSKKEEVKQDEPAGTSSTTN